MVLPEPVGPVTRIIPYGCFKIALNFSTSLDVIPRSSMFSMRPAESNSLMTSFSP